MTDKEWQKFLEWMYTAHQIMRNAWKPCRESIKLWEEYKKVKK